MTDSRDTEAFFTLHADLPRQGKRDAIAARVAAAGFETIDTQRLSDVAREGYFRPMEDPITRLSPAADMRLSAALEHGVADIASGRVHRHETGYLSSVVKPS